MHMYSLAYCLSEQGNKVIVITRAYDNRHSVRFLPMGLKIYYLPISNWPIGSIVYPYTGFNNFCLYRDVIFREKIDVVHMHQTTSTMILDFMFIAICLGKKTIVTDHSMWSLDRLGDININKVWNVHRNFHHYICVSHAVRENFVVRANVNPEQISTIPNAIDASRFKPDPTKRFPLGTINIVVMSRLEYRKGFDLLIEVIPEVCKRYENVYWIIGGDGSKMPC